MPAAHDFILLGDHDAGRRLVASALEAQGFLVSATPRGGLLAKRGSIGMTLLLGALAGSKFQVTFLVELMVDAESHLVARLNRDMTAGALKGGAVGAAKVNRAFQETANAIHSALQRAGVLAVSVAR
ncbi:hypothetical protein SAMN04515691_2921 [Leifsonia sp. 98AMF]|uniref:hypothetical protein n=1 Tax=unclassified Leifsonia TaxID=2663824 RepID=UPI00087C8D68|nr:MULTISPECIES: hypothetical protein [unclassified Leifsonia]SDH17554.1 hypothetical protein SAMN04515690_1095 [Leifsonia sp. 197AMF]SDJ20849.1 hypothetical protein SAMN04515684_2687 [Leifsonia sp. 466MF]SDJ44456.1 hypothetical protein SAMN04515683_0056 [Leifsonia sp. 157MF]SDN42432.1 hypothetical protein SAMN04515686_0871 [Leifsonia sp. 509MF]SEM78003.1 hypothetical protein SAMN04515685_0044 [Leifsonia sp. 467MF]